MYCVSEHEENKKDALSKKDDRKKRRYVRKFSLARLKIVTMTSVCGLTDGQTKNEANMTSRFDKRTSQEKILRNLTSSWLLLSLLVVC